jgi:hypothetical protein
VKPAPKELLRDSIIDQPAAVHAQDPIFRFSYSVIVDGFQPLNFS